MIIIPVLLEQSHDHQYCKNGHKEKHCNTIANCHSTNIASSLKRALHNVKYVIEEVDTALTTMREYEDIAWKLKEPLYEPDSVLTSQDEDVIRRARNTTIMSACGMALATGVACNANGNIPGFLRGVFTLSAGMILHPYLWHARIHILSTFYYVPGTTPGLS